MLRPGAYVAALLLAGCSHVTTPREWHDFFYTVNGTAVILREAPTSRGCILATGPRDVRERLEARAITGRAQLLMERLPFPPFTPNVSGVTTGPNIVLVHQYVPIRGIRVPFQPQCRTKDIYWIKSFRFLGAYVWNDAGVLVPEPPNQR